MRALTFAVVLVGALCVLDLLLTFGVIRRLRADTGSRSPQGGSDPGPPMAPVGTAIRGTGLDWDGETLVGFFLPDCGPCEQQFPEFMEYARTQERVVAVVSDPAGKGAELVRKLGEVAQVVVEAGTDGVLRRAFQVQGFPSYCLVGDGRIIAVVGRAADLPDQAARIPA
jgi:hypothetical protein